MKNWIFDDPLHKKGPVLVILMPGMIQPSGSGGNGNLETAEVFKALKITTEDLSHPSSSIQ